MNASAPPTISAKSSILVRKAACGYLVVDHRTWQRPGARSDKRLLSLSALTDRFPKRKLGWCIDQSKLQSNKYLEGRFLDTTPCTKPLSLLQSRWFLRGRKSGNNVPSEAEKQTTRVSRKWPENSLRHSSLCLVVMSSPFCRFSLGSCLTGTQTFAGASTPTTARASAT